MFSCLCYFLFICLYFRFWYFHCDFIFVFNSLVLSHIQLHSYFILIEFCCLLSLEFSIKIVVFSHKYIHKMLFIINNLYGKALETVYFFLFLPRVFRFSSAPWVHFPSIRSIKCVERTCQNVSRSIFMMALNWAGMEMRKKHDQE